MKLIFFSVLVYFSFSYASQAQMYRNKGTKLPKFEMGAGAVYGVAPHYPGANQNNKILLPFPTFLYRGEILRSDEDGGFRGRFFHNDRYELNLSIGGFLPARSKDNNARSGMPNLDTVLEFGPGFIFHFIPKSDKGRFKLSLNIPFRFAFSSDFHDTRQRGFVFNPLLYSWYEWNDKFSTFLSISGRWNTQKFNDYYYSVENKYVTAERGLYKARSGHMLTAYSAAIVFNRSQKFSVFTGLTYMNYKNSTNKNSPLMIRKDNISYALGVIWWFYQKQ